MDNPPPFAVFESIPSDLLFPLPPDGEVLQPCRPFVIVKPSGLGWLQRVREHIARDGLSVIRDYPITNYELVARCLYRLNGSNRTLFHCLLATRP